MIDLDDLEDLFEDLPFDDPTPAQIHEMYGAFLDLKKNPLIINGRRLKVNQNPSRHPLFKNKDETFVHIVTRESHIAQKRNFDKHRANKIHWIRPILENAGDDRIRCFERLNDEKVNQHYFWFVEQDFTVILREVDPDFLLITAFCIDKDEQKKFQRWYEEHKASKK